MAYLLFLNMLMTVRLAYLVSARDSAPSTVLWVGGFQLLGLFIFGGSSALLVAGLLLALTTGLTWYLARRQAPLEGIHSLSFLLIAAAASFLFNGGIEFAGWFSAGAEALAQRSILLAGAGPDDWYACNLVLCGALFLTNEVNQWIRWALRRLSLEPPGSRDGTATESAEYNAGRIIGILERNLIYLVVVIGNSYAAVGFILAAKGFARFRQLDERQFAEYMLIGTLASTLSTLVVAALVTSVLG